MNANREAQPSQRAASTHLARWQFKPLRRWWLHTGQFSWLVRMVSPSRRRNYAAAAEGFARYKRIQSEVAFLNQALDAVPLCASVLAQELARAERAQRIPDSEAAMLARTFTSDQAAQFVARRRSERG